MVDSLELADDVQPDFGEFVLEQVEEQGQKVLDGGVLAKQRSEASDLVSDGSTDVLRLVLAKVSDARNDARQNDFLLEQLCETLGAY